MADYEERNDRFTEIEDQYAGYEVYDRNGEKVGKVDDLFVDEGDRPEYIGVKTSLLKKSLPDQSGIQNELKTPEKQAQNTT